MRAYRSAATVLALAAAVSACASRPREADPLVFLLMGQSNMSGRGALAEAAPADLEEDPRIMALRNDGILAVAREPIDSAEGQQDVVSADPTAGVGPGLAFAKELVARSEDRRIVLVPCAKGGTSITAWDPRGGVDGLYGVCLARARAASEAGTLAGVLWYQGESDSETSEQARAWPGRFRDLIDRLRMDLDSPRLPVVFVSIGDEPLNGRFAGRFKAWSELQGLQSAFEAPCTRSVAAAGLPRNSDELHLSTAGQLVLGRRMAVAWTSLAHRCR